MFATHQPTIAAAAQQDLGIFEDAGLLCILSARRPFGSVGEDFASVKGGDHTPLFAWKSEAWRLHQQNAFVRRETLNALDARRKDYIAKGALANASRLETEMLAYVLKWYGLNLIKGGFFLQLCYGIAGCIDTRNERDYGVSAASIRAVPESASRKAREKRAKAYLKLCRDLGGTERLWDAWCTYYAESGDNPIWHSGWDVSAEHCAILGLPTGEQGYDEIPF